MAIINISLDNKEYKYIICLCSYMGLLSSYIVDGLEGAIYCPICKARIYLNKTI